MTRREYLAAWREQNREKARLEAIAWRAANVERSRAAVKSWRARNREWVKQNNKEWRTRNPESGRCRWMARRARKINAKGRYNVVDVQNLYRKQGGRCVGCPTYLLFSCTVDHKTPLSRGGSNWPRNLQLLCQPCNDKKGVKTQREWRASL